MPTSQILLTAHHALLTLRPRIRRQADPNNAAALASYAVFIHDERGDAEQASALFEEAASLAPADLDVLASWAYFAMTARK